LTEKVNDPEDERTQKRHESDDQMTEETELEM
jgi:hypothetical protein